MTKKTKYDEPTEAEVLKQTLDKLYHAEGFYVKQNWDALETLSGCYEQANTYSVSSIPQRKEDRKKGLEGAIKYFEADERTGICSRECCGKNRGFEFRFLDFETKKTVIEIKRKWRCCGWAVIPCCAHRVDVHSMLQADQQGGLEVVGHTSDNTLAAQVQVPMWHGGCCCATFYLNNEEKKRVGSISGYTCWYLPCVLCDFCGAEFFVYNNDGAIVGKLEKLGVSSCKDCLLELRTDADKYSVEFSADQHLDLNFKLAVLAAVIQIDFNYFEDKRGIRQCHCCDIACCGYDLQCIPLCFFTLCCFCCVNSNNLKDKEGGLLPAQNK